MEQVIEAQVRMVTVTMRMQTMFMKLVTVIMLKTMMRIMFART